MIAEIIRVGTSRLELLSEKAGAAAFSDKPIDPARIAAWQARDKANAKPARRAGLRRSRKVKPMRFADIALQVTLFHDLGRSQSYRACQFATPPSVPCKFTGEGP